MSTAIIVMTGPESSGKTTLATHLAGYYKAPLISEVARDYLAGKNSYEKSDLLEIAKLQYQEERRVVARRPKKIICDTDLLVVMIWSEVKYGCCDPWISETFEKGLHGQTSTRYYCLCDSKIPWENDQLRENPDNRKALFELYRQKLNKYRLEYRLVEGAPQQRLQQVVSYFKSQ